MIRQVLLRYVAPLIILASSLLGLQVVTSQPVFASHGASNGCTSGSLLNFPNWNHYLTHNPAMDCVVQGFDFPNDIWLVLVAILEILFRLTVIVSIGFLMRGGIWFIYAQGNPEKISMAKSTIENSLIGLVLSLLSVSIIAFVTRSLV